MNHMAVRCFHLKIKAVFVFIPKFGTVFARRGGGGGGGEGVLEGKGTNVEG